MFMIDLTVPSHYSVLGLAPDASVERIRDAKRKIVGDLRRQCQRARGEDDKARLTARIVDINRIGDLLSNQNMRVQYDRENAHLTFFVLRRAVAPVFDAREVRLRWIHRTVRDFLLQKGESVEPVMDLERTDFSADATEDELLDDLLRSWCGPGGQVE